MKRSHAPSLVLVGLSLMLAVAQVSGQTAYGTIVGVITDSTAAAIPGAEVSVTNVGTNISSDVTTGPDGGYAVARLIPGLYRVEVSYGGFKTAASPELTLLVNQTLRFDAALERPQER